MNTAPVDEAEGVAALAPVSAVERAAFTKGPWEWMIHDHSMASLGVGENPGMGDPLVLAIGPCGACTKRANPQEWKWGRCYTPSEADARLIAASPTMYDALCRIHSWLVCAPICTPDDMMQAVAEMEQLASKAIAKAEGRS